jgi:hypothetical protein
MTHNSNIILVKSTFLLFINNKIIKINISFEILIILKFLIAILILLIIEKITHFL